MELQNSNKTWPSKKFAIGAMTFAALFILFIVIISTGDSQPPLPTQGIIFDIPSLFGKSFSQIKTAIGSPLRGEEPKGYPLDEVGWAEWEKEGLVLGIFYDEGGRLIDAGGLGCAISVYPKRENWKENKLRTASNLNNSNYPFRIKSLKNIDGIFYGLEVCYK
ncbi:MAG: hypothetical protein HYY86_02820 [Candidatus Harrisonbacteria bacterium]|nr:hypothetical protein [Candidatus Harrisonbacteria bacterium]